MKDCFVEEEGTENINVIDELFSNGNLPQRVGELSRFHQLLALVPSDGVGLAEDE